jgi:hypothetical protein
MNPAWIRLKNKTILHHFTQRDKAAKINFILSALLAPLREKLITKYLFKLLIFIHLLA